MVKTALMRLCLFALTKDKRTQDDCLEMVLKVLVAFWIWFFVRFASSFLFISLCQESAKQFSSQMQKWWIQTKNKPFLLAV